MALSDDVNYTFYNQALGRTAVPDADAFNANKLENVLQMQQLIDDGLISEKVENGYVSACCLWIEESYKESEIEAGNTAVDTGENIGSYSYSTDMKAYDVAIEKNSKSTAQKKYKWLGFYCNILTARC